MVQSENTYDKEKYEGDLETDLLRVLSLIQKAAKENPIDVELDFRR